MFQEKYKLEDVMLSKEDAEYNKVTDMFYEKTKMGHAMLGNDATEYVKVKSNSQDLQLQ